MHDVSSVLHCCMSTCCLRLVLSEQALGGFKDWPLLEDVELVGRLQRVSPPAIVPQAVQTSGR